VLYWVKEWDPIVFNKVSVAPKKSFFAKRNEKKNTNGSDKPAGPEHKILLICGPPGVGKTTLAHIVAKQAGYHPVEVNASDDRSRDKLMSLIENSTQMRNNMFGDNKPNLLILDEIDGLENSETRSGISALLQLAYPTKAPKEDTKTKDNKTKEKDGKKTKKKGPKQLNRPIICICNDQ
jgi:chromosome transmission fidelity protein 18